MRCRLWALTGLLLGMATAVRAERLPVKTYGLADGLPSTFVDHIVSDSRGLLWFSTRDGLARFDGSRFVTYGIEDGPAYRDMDNPNAALFHIRTGDADRAMQWFQSETFRAATRLAKVTGRSFYDAQPRSRG